jgi:hypothetical protein
MTTPAVGIRFANHSLRCKWFVLKRFHLRPVSAPAGSPFGRHTIRECY